MLDPIERKLSENDRRLLDRRKKAIELFNRGVFQSEIARQLQVTRQAVSKWILTFKEKGENYVAVERYRGRPRKIDPTHEKELYALLHQKPKEHGYPDNNWTVRRIKETLNRKLGTNYDATYIYHRMHAYGWRSER